MNQLHFKNYYVHVNKKHIYNSTDELCYVHFNDVVNNMQTEVVKLSIVEEDFLVVAIINLQ